MITRRDARIVMEAMTGRTYADLASEHNVSLSRIGQIITSVLGQLGMSGPGLSKEVVGCALARWHERTPDFPSRGSTPKSYYWDELHFNLPAAVDAWY